MTNKKINIKDIEQQPYAQLADDEAKAVSGGARNNRMRRDTNEQGLVSWEQIDIMTKKEEPGSDLVSWEEVDTV